MTAAIRQGRTVLRGAAIALVAASALTFSSGYASARTGTELFRDVCVASGPDFSSLPRRLEALGAQELDDLKTHLFTLIEPTSSRFWTLAQVDGAQAKVLIGLADGRLGEIAARTCFLSMTPSDGAGELTRVFPDAEQSARSDRGVFGWSETVVTRGAATPLWFFVRGRGGSDVGTGEIIAITLVSTPGRDVGEALRAFEPKL